MPPYPSIFDRLHRGEGGTIVEENYILLIGAGSGGYGVFGMKDLIHANS